MNGLKILLVFLLFLVVFSVVVAPKVSPNISTGNVAPTTTTSTNNYTSLQEGPRFIAPPSYPLKIFSPISEGKTVKIKPGDAVSIDFQTDYWCASGYDIFIYPDGKPLDIAAKKTVTGLGWLRGYAYGGIPVCSREGANIIKEIIGVSSTAVDGSYSLEINVYDYQGRLAVKSVEESAIIVESLKANLVVKEFKILTGNVQSTSIDSGTSLNVSAIVSNDGDISAKEFEVIAYYFDDASAKKEFGSKVFSLEALKESQVEFVLDTSEIAGTYSVEISANPLKAFPEKNESDNSASGIVSISSNVANNSDLYVFLLQIFPELEASQGETIEVTATIANKGKLPAQSFNVDFFKIENESIVKLDNTTISSLNQNSDVVLKFSYTLTKELGDQEFGVMIDSSNNVTESIESNNKSTGPFIVVALRLETVEKCYDELDNDGDKEVDEFCYPDIQLLGVKNVIPSKGSPIELNGGTFAVLKSVDDSFRINLFSKTFFGDKKNTPAKTYLNAKLCVNVAKTDGSNGLSMTFAAPKELSDSPQKLDEFLIKENYLDFARDFFILESYNWNVNGQKKLLPSSVSSGLYYNEWVDGFPLNPKTLGFVPGAYSVVFTANCNNGTAEFSQLKENNTTGVTLQFSADSEVCNGIDDNLNGIIDEGCDIGIEQFSVGSKINSALCSESAQVVVTNFGTISSAPVMLGLFDEFPSKLTIPLQEKIIPSLAPNESFTAEFSQILPEKTIVEWFAGLDVENVFPENDSVLPNNNYRREAIQTVPSSPDGLNEPSDQQLVVSDVAFLTPVVRPPQEVDAKIVVQNTGYDQAENVQVNVTISGPQTPLQSFDLVIPFIAGNDFPPGSESLIGGSCADQSGGIGELRSSENFSSNKISFLQSGVGEELPGPPQAAAIPIIVESSTVPISESQVQLFVATDSSADCLWDNVSRGYNEMLQAGRNATGGMSSVGDKLVHQAFGVESVDGLNSYYVSCAPVTCIVIANEVSCTINFAQAMPSAYLISYENFSFAVGLISIPTINAKGRVLVRACIENLDGSNSCSDANFLSTPKPNIALDLDSLIDSIELLPDGRIVHNISGSIANNGFEDANIPANSEFVVSVYSSRGVVQGANYLCGPDGICLFCPGYYSYEECRENEYNLKPISSKSIASFTEVPPSNPPAEPQQVLLATTVLTLPPNETIAPGESVDFSVPVNSAALPPGESEVIVTADDDGVVNEDDDSDNSGTVGLQGGEGYAYPGTCFNGIDDDGDGDIDAQDEDCIFRLEDPANNNCNDGFDNDFDGLVDQDDPGCQVPPIEICGNGIDEDLDGEDLECLPVELQDPNQPNSEGEICSDSIDNDFDGVINEGCNNLVELCSNLIDDDLDGLVDEVPPCVASLGGDVPIVPGIEVQVADLIIDVGDYQFITVVSEDGVPLNGALVKVISPCGTFYLEVGENGTVNFVAQCDGEYTVVVFYKGLEKQVTFRSVKPFLLQYGVIGEVASNIFGETVKENIWYIPLIGLLALLSAYLAYQMSQQIFSIPKASKERMFFKAQAIVAAAIFFLMPFLVNKLVNFTASVGVAILELVFLFALNYYFKERARKTGKMGKI
ncbi:MAG: CARDB domain-containing protein [archaeon]|nr:CARDB domain-containing protein [archaeon]